MEYVTQYKVSSTLDEVHWALYKEDATVKVQSLSKIAFTVAPRSCQYPSMSLIVFQ